MSIEIADFAESLHQEVLARSVGPEEGQLREEAFTEHMLEVLADADEVGDADICYYRSRGRKGVPPTKVNAYGFSGDGETLDLFVSCYSGLGARERMTAGETRRYLELVGGFLDRSLAGFHSELEESHPVFGLARQIFTEKQTLTSVRMYLLTDKEAALPNESDLRAEAGSGLKLRYVVWDLARLHQFHTSGSKRQAVVLDFENDLGGAIPCIGTEDESDEYLTLLAFFPGTVLQEAYSEFGPRLLEKNVRAFLQVRGNINKGIQQTIVEEPHRFLAYNNGISATASSVDLEKLEDGVFRLRSASDFQIVNGGQTTASLHHAVRKDGRDISSVKVQVKITVTTDPETLQDFVPLISRYANSQNKVNTADFSAHGPFHQKLEELSRTVWAPPAAGLERGTRWYYERARGSYLDEKARAGTPARRRRWEGEHPTSQKFTKTDLAKFENSWACLPNLVSLGAEKNFGHWTQRCEEEGWPVVDQRYFENLVAKAILFRSAEKIISRQGIPGYRANLVTYSIAWLVESAERRIPLDTIWKTQNVPDPISRALDVVSRAAREFITNPPGGMNVTEWCKKEGCWQKFRKVRIDLPGTFSKSLATQPFDVLLDAHGREENLKAIQKVQSQPAQFWYALSKWAKEHGVLQPWQRSLAFSLGRVASQSKAPSVKQAIQGVKIMEKAAEEGYKYPLE